MNKLSPVEILRRARTKVQVGSDYRHYRGGVYKVLNVVLYESTVKPLVIYQYLRDTGTAYQWLRDEGTGSKDSHTDLVWARDIDDFCSIVIIDRKMVKRFELMR